MHVSMWMARETCRQVYWRVFGRDMVITSAMRPKSPGGSSLHPQGRALDLRTRDLTTAEARYLTRQIAEALGEDFDVILEGWQSTDSRLRNRAPHIHVEYDPKGRHAQELGLAEVEDGEDE